MGAHLPYVSSHVRRSAHRMWRRAHEAGLFGSCAGWSRLWDLVDGGDGTLITITMCDAAAADASVERAGEWVREMLPTRWVIAGGEPCSVAPADDLPPAGVVLGRCCRAPRLDVGEIPLDLELSVVHGVAETVGDRISDGMSHVRRK